MRAFTALFNPMPKKLFKRFIPTISSVKTNPGLKFLGPLLNDPNLFHLNRYSVSMASLMGVFCAFLPIPGQMAVAAVLALAVRCNLPIAVALVWITNPVTIAPIFYSTYKLGTWLLEVPVTHSATKLISWETLDNMNLVAIWKPLIVGSLCAGSLFSLISYFLVRYIWRFYVIFQWKNRKEKRNRKPSKTH